MLLPAWCYVAGPAFRPTITANAVEKTYLCVSFQYFPSHLSTSYHTSVKHRVSAHNINYKRKVKHATENRFMRSHKGLKFSGLSVQIWVEWWSQAQWQQTIRTRFLNHNTVTSQFPTKWCIRFQLKHLNNLVSYYCLFTLSFFNYLFSLTSPIPHDWTCTVHACKLGSNIHHI